MEGRNLFVNGSLKQPSLHEIRVTLRSVETDYEQIDIGKAVKMERDRETGAVSFEIESDVPYDLSRVISSMYITGLSVEKEDGVNEFHSAVIREIALSAHPGINPVQVRI